MGHDHEARVSFSFVHTSTADVFSATPCRPQPPTVLHSKRFEKKQRGQCITRSGKMKKEVEEERPLQAMRGVWCVSPFNRLLPRPNGNAAGFFFSFSFLSPRIFPCSSVPVLMKRLAPQQVAFGGCTTCLVLHFPLPNVLKKWTQNFIMITVLVLIPITIVLNVLYLSKFRGFCCRFPRSAAYRFVGMLATVDLSFMFIDTLFTLFDWPPPSYIFPILFFLSPFTSFKFIHHDVRWVDVNIIFSPRSSMRAVLGRAFFTLNFSFSPYILETLKQYHAYCFKKNPSFHV